jgi:RNA polymerase sigma factor (sigma-70 family)
MSMEDKLSSNLPLSLLYHFCRLRLPGVPLSLVTFERHLVRAQQMAAAKRAKKGLEDGWSAFLDNLYVLDLFLSCACLERQPRAWECLFAARASRTDSLLVDALRARAVRLFPRDLEKQEEAVTDFWGYLLAGEREGAVPILARYDGQRPLVPWLIRVFHNKHLSDLRPNHQPVALPGDDMLDEAEVQLDSHQNEHWYEEFRTAARDWLAELNDTALLILGLRLRYRLSQREVAEKLGIHEGNVSRRTTELSKQCQEHIARRLQELGWTGDDLSGFIHKEMESLLLDEPRLAADRLAALLAARGKATSMKPTRA